MAQIEDPTEILSAGIRACAQGRWREGHRLLTGLAQAVEGKASLPGLFYGYLGQAIARCEGRKRVGLELCQHAVEMEPFRPENHLNLASVYVMVNNRWAAFRALKAGLALDPDHPGLVTLHRKLGVRRRPALRFLSRSHPLNRILGGLQHSLETHREAYRLRRAEEAEDDEAWREILDS